MTVKAWRILAAATAAVIFPVTLAGCTNPNAFTNCTAMHAEYPHGVGLVGAVDHTSGSKPVTTFYRSNTIYNANTKLDADHDHIACERL